ncbi:MAG: GH32 C-terminal domain-containing protein, partial [Candidatus Limnocylindrales bacterium]
LLPVAMFAALALTQATSGTGGLVLDLRLVVDGSALEVFVDGRVSATFRLPSIHRGPRRIVAWSKGATSIVRRLEVWPLETPAGQR